MPAVSKKQQRFFGMVHACQKSGNCASPEVKKVAGSISYDDADDFASTKHKGLPEKKKLKEIALELGRYPTFLEYVEHCEKELRSASKNAKLNVSKYDPKELHKGYEVEEEHDGKEGKDVDVVDKDSDRLKIAVAHLREDPKYYTKLKKAGL